MNIEKSIEILKGFRNYNKFYKEENRDLTITITLDAKESIDKAIERLLTAYEKEKEKRENQKKELAILNAKQIEFNKLVNTVNSYKGQFKRQEKKIEELKNGQIDFWISDKEIEDRIRNKFVSKDKIKAKIEELNNKLKNADEVEAVFIIKQQQVLQSLLEKE